MDPERAAAVLAPLEAVDWSALRHAYGPAEDTPAQLRAFVLGDDATVGTAFDALNGSVWHQGTVYSATLPALGVLCGVGAWPGHRGRGLALALVEWITESDDGDPELVRSLRREAEANADAMLGDWRAAPEAIRRAQLLLLAGLPEARPRYRELEALLPAEHRVAWERRLAGAEPVDDAEGDLLDALEGWGWTLAFEEAPPLR